MGNPDKIEAILYFYEALILLSAAPDSIFDLSIHPLTSSEIQQRIAENQAKLKHWAEYAPMNYLHKWQLVEAERYRVLGLRAEAIDFYDQAIAGAQEHGYLQEEALANELAAKFYLAWGKEKVAAVYMQTAYYCYSRWGAKTKVVHLENFYPKLLAPILQSSSTPSLILGQTLTSIQDNTSSTSSTIINDLMDLSSILEISQSFYSEIHLSKLVQHILDVVVRSAGADSGALLLNNSGNLEVVVNYFDCQVNSDQSQPIDSYTYLPLSIIRYVERTGEDVLANRDIPVMFPSDPYLIARQPKSLLCKSIFKQGRIIGILYLENNLAADAFTPVRMNLLQFLCTQAAISLENAQLYERSQQALADLQQALNELQKAQLQIVQSEKMSALGNLVAGVAHEMNNPLGFISASLVQAKPTLGDLMKHLELYRASLPEPSESILHHAESIDLDYSLEDLPKMVDSMILACDRLKNISTSLRTFSRADQEYKVSFNIHEGIDSTILILKHRLKANKDRPEIEVVTAYADLPQIKCFPGQLNQVFMNILANAIDAVDESNHGRSFTEIQANPHKIIVKTSAEDNQVIKISIADNGKGMSEEVKQRIFDHLFTTKAVGKGTGLGLAITKQIVEETHGGNLSCNSVLGKGTEFVIQIPIV